MWVQELFTELKKLAPLLRCDVAKLGPKRSFRGICIGNTPKKIDFQNLKKLITFGQNTQISPFLAKLQHYKLTTKIIFNRMKGDHSLNDDVAGENLAAFQLTAFRQSNCFFKHAKMQSKIGHIWMR